MVRGLPSAGGDGGCARRRTSCATGRSQEPRRTSRKPSGWRSCRVAAWISAAGNWPSWSRRRGEASGPGPIEERRPEETPDQPQSLRDALHRQRGQTRRQDLAPEEVARVRPGSPSRSRRPGRSTPCSRRSEPGAAPAVPPGAPQIAGRSARRTSRCGRAASGNTAGSSPAWRRECPAAGASPWRAAGRGQAARPSVRRIRRGASCSEPPRLRHRARRRRPHRPRLSPPPRPTPRWRARGAASRASGVGRRASPRPPPRRDRRVPSCRRQRANQVWSVIARNLRGDNSRWIRPRDSEISPAPGSVQIDFLYNSICDNLIVFKIIRFDCQGHLRPPPRGSAGRHEDDGSRRMDPMKLP